MFELKIYPKNRDWMSVPFRYNDMEALMIAAQSMMEHYSGEYEALVCEISIVKAETPEPEIKAEAENDTDESEEN